MGKLASGIYGATRKLGKVASTVNTLEHVGKTIKTGDPSHLAKHVARKATTKASHKGANEVSRAFNKLFK